MFKIKFLLWVVCVFCVGFFLYGGESLLLQNSISEKTLRLHVLANSDSVADQEEKLSLRDHLMGEVLPLTEDCSSLAQAQEILSMHFGDLEYSCNQFLREQGSCHSVRIKLSEENYGTRFYDGISMPAGDYPSLQVFIGEGRGQNWWCVVFPSLSTSAETEDLNIEGYNRAEISLIRNEKDTYHMRFKVMEWANSLLQFLQNLSFRKKQL